MSSIETPFTDALYDLHVFACVNQRPDTHKRGCCARKGALNLANYMCRLTMVKARDQRIRINLAGCLNACEHGPAVVIYPEGVWYRCESEADVEEIVQQHIVHGRRVERLLIHFDRTQMHT